MADDFYSVDFEGNVHGSLIYCPHCFRVQMFCSAPETKRVCDTCHGQFSLKKVVQTTYITRKEYDHE